MALDSAGRKKRAAAAVAKQARGEKLSREQVCDRDWLQARGRDAQLRESLAAVPKGLYCQLAARQQKGIDEHGRRHQLPLLGSEVDLFAAIKAFHDLLARHSRALLSAGEGDLFSERLRGQIDHLRTKRRLLDLEIEQKQDTLVSRDELRELLTWWQQRLRAFGELLGRRYGREAQQALNDFLYRTGEDPNLPAESKKRGAK